MEIKIKKKYLFINLFIICSLVFLYFSEFTKLIIANRGVLIILSFIINTIICFLGVIKDKYKYSLNKSFWLFSLIFFCLAPVIQYITDSAIWRVKIAPEYYLKTNILLLLCFAVYSFFYKAGNKKNPKEKNDVLISKKDQFILDIVYLALSIISVLLLSHLVGFSNLFFRKDNSILSIEDSLLNHLINYTLRVTPVYCFALNYKRNKKINVLLLIELICIIVCNFPTSVTRFWMGSIYFGLFCYIIKNNKYNRWFDLVVVSTFFLLFPILFSFKSVSSNTTALSLAVDVANSFSSVDYDAYSILARTIMYVESNGILFGKQIIGTLLFFIPRSIWASKPQATGILIVSSQGQNWYTNVSCPFFAEGLINFGLLGAVGFTALLAHLLGRFDRKHWNDGTELFDYFYPFLTGFMFFLLRGAIHHAVVYMFIFFIPYIFILIIKFFARGGSKWKKLQ